MMLDARGEQLAVSQQTTNATLEIAARVVALHSTTPKPAEQVVDTVRGLSAALHASHVALTTVAPDGIRGPRLERRGHGGFMA